jgi:predicted PurR-regulated permease PerM
MPRKIEISHKTIVFTILFLIGLWFLYFIRDIILQIFVSLLIMTILNPTVTRLQKRKIPRVASIIIVYLLLLAFIVFAVATLIPALVTQTASFTSAVPRILEDLNLPIFVVDRATQEITSQISNLPSQLIRIGVSVFSNIISVITVFFFALYFLLSRNKLDEQLTGMIGKEHAERIDKVLRRLEKDLGGWARGQLILMIMVGLATYVGLLILGIPYALPLALLAGVLEIIPNLGPFLSAIPAVLVGLGISPFTGLAVAALGFLIQQVENYIFVPKVMQRSANVSPVVTLLALVIGFRVAGVVGAILSVPIVITSRVLLTEYTFKKK